LFPENSAVYETMWKNTAEPDRPQRWQYSVNCRKYSIALPITKARILSLSLSHTHTHTHTLIIPNTYSLSTATMFTLTRLTLRYGTLILFFPENFPKITLLLNMWTLYCSMVGYQIRNSTWLFISCVLPLMTSFEAINTVVTDPFKFCGT